MKKILFLLSTLFVFIQCMTTELAQNKQSHQYNAVLISGYWKYVDEGYKFYDDDKESEKRTFQKVLSKQELSDFIEKYQLFRWINRSFFAKVVFIEAISDDKNCLISEEEKQKFLKCAKKEQGAYLDHCQER